MWARKRPDIGWCDLAAALGYSANLTRPAPSTTTVAHNWLQDNQTLVCLSVRSGFDILLQALQLPRGSEVILSAVTIPDMVRIIEHHGLVPVPVEVDSSLLEPTLANVEKAITPKSRLILVAHLFGSRTRMKPIIHLGKQHGLFVAEDCAQAFVGSEFAGHPDSDISLFSFGPIKTATALGGAVLRVKQPRLLAAMREIQHTYDQQGRGEYLAKIAKYTLLKTASYPWLYGAIERVCSLLSISHDRLISQLGHNFAGSSLLRSIRRRPCSALQWLLARRIQQFATAETHRLNRRTRIGRYLTRGLLSPTSHWTGHTNGSHTYWVLAACTTQASKLVRALRQAGFDATMRSSLCNASQPHHPIDTSSRRWLEQTVFVPCDPDMPAKELQRLRRKLQEVLSSPSKQAEG